MITHIAIPDKCLKAIPHLTKAQQRLIVSSMLLQVNLPVFRAINLNLKVPRFGTITTHGNRKQINKLKYVKKYNKKKWKQDKLKKSLTIKKLLF